MVLDAAAKLSRALGAAGADAVVSRSGDATRRPAASSSGVRPEATTAAALAATGPHSMFR
jgi:hypothetical protein